MKKANVAILGLGVLIAGSLAFAQSPGVNSLWTSLESSAMSYIRFGLKDSPRRETHEIRSNQITGLSVDFDNARDPNTSTTVKVRLDDKREITYSCLAKSEQDNCRITSVAIIGDPDVVPIADPFVENEPCDSAPFGGNEPGLNICN